MKKEFILKLINFKIDSKKEKAFLFFALLLLGFSKAEAVDDVISTGTYNISTITVNDPNIGNGGTLPINDFMESVMAVEVGPFDQGDSSFQNGFNANAIAILTYVQWKIQKSSDPASYVIPISEFDANGNQITSGVLSYSLSYVVGSNTLIQTAVQNTQNQVLTYFNNSPIDSEFSSRYGTFTNNSENSSNYGYYNPYLRESPNQEDPSLPAGNSAEGAGVGLIQRGSMDLSSLQGRTATQILYHYYHSMPPIVRAVTIVQGGVIEGEDPTNSHDATTDISGGTTIYTSSWTDAGATRTFSSPVSLTASGAVSLQFEITFSEQVDYSSIAVTLMSASNPQGVAVQDVVVDFWGNLLGPNAQPTYWFGDIEADELAGLGTGPVTVQISAVHEYVPGGVLDSNPADVAFYFDGNPNYSLDDPGTYQPGPDTNHVFQIPTLPYIQSVVASQGASVFYSASWPVTAQSATILGDLSFNTFAPMPNPGSSMALTLVFSEYMATTTSPAVTFLLNTDLEIPVTSTGPNDGWVTNGAGQAMTWSINSQAGYLPVTYRGDMGLGIGGTV